MMQMLAAGGMAVLSDGVRQPDRDNPRGYLEWERIRTLPKDPECILEAEGKAVKVISSLLYALPANRNYRVIFMRRPVMEIAASQAAMLARRGTPGPGIESAALLGALDAHARQVTAWLTMQAHLPVLWVDYHDLVNDPARQARSTGSFLMLQLHIAAMIKTVVPSLYRTRLAQGAGNLDALPTAISCVRSIS